jgi:hypothetical protein
LESTRTTPSTMAVVLLFFAYTASCVTDPGPSWHAPGHTPTYAQLYIHEPRAALDYRMLNNPTLRRDTMETLQAVIRDSNPHAHLFRHSYEVLRDHGDDAENNSVRLRVAPGVHARNLQNNGRTPKPIVKSRKYSYRLFSMS